MKHQNQPGLYHSYLPKSTAEIFLICFVHENCPDYYKLILTNLTRNISEHRDIVNE